MCGTLLIRTLHRHADCGRDDERSNFENMCSIFHIVILITMKKYIMVLQNPKVHIIALGGFNNDWTKEEIPLFVNTIKDRGYLYTPVGVQGCFET